jgi:hypothetical protein
LHKSWIAIGLPVRSITFSQSPLGLGLAVPVKLIARPLGEREYHLRLPTEVAAKGAAHTIRQMGHHADIGPSLAPGSWEVLVRTSPSPVPEVLGRTRKTLGAIADVLGGLLEGYEFDLV